MTANNFLNIEINFGVVHFFILLCILLIAVYFDIKSRRIPNWLVLTGIIISLVTQSLETGNGFSDWALGLLVGFLLFFPLYIFRIMGAGDVKLMATIGAFVGPIGAVQAVLLTLVSGGVLAIIFSLRAGAFRSTLENVRFILTRTAIQKNGLDVDVASVSAGKMPYALAIAGGTFTHLLLRLGHQPIFQ